MALGLSEPLGGPLVVPLGLLKRALLLRRSAYAHSVWLGLTEEEGGTSTEDALYYGDGESLQFLESLHGRRRDTGDRINWRELGALLRDRTRTFTIYAEINRLCSWSLPRGGYSTLPWIRQKVPLKGTRKRPGDRSVEGVYGRRVRRYGYVCKFRQDALSLAEFFDDMYRPYLEYRFGAMAHPRTLQELERAQRAGFLLEIEEQGHRVAGAVCLVQRRELTLLALAVAPPFPDHLRRGALSAVYYFLIGWASEHSLEWVDLLRSRPHIADGVYEHKRRFGAQPYADPWPHTTIRIYPPRSGDLPEVARGLLVRNGSGFSPLAERLAVRHGDPVEGA